MRSVWRPALVTLPVLLVTCYLFSEGRHSERLLLEVETARQADNAASQIQEFASTQLETLQDAGNFVASLPEDEAVGRFDGFVARLFSKKTAFFSVTWKQPEGTTLARVKNAPPGESEVNVPGSLLTEAESHAATTRHAVATLSLQVGPGLEGIEMVIPLLREGQFIGWVEGDIRLTSGVSRLFGRDVLDFWNIELYDHTGRCAYRALAAGLDPAADSHPPMAERHVPVVDLAWKMRLWPTPLLVSTLRTGAPWRILGIGLTATGLLGVASYLLAQHQTRLAVSLSESKRLAADVAATQKHLHEVVNGVEAAIWESDAEMQRFTFVNDYARKLLGIRQEEWISRPAYWYEHVHPEDRELALANARAAHTPGWTYPVEYRMLKSDGETLWVQEIITVIGEGESVRGRRSVVVDITARMQAEEALRQSQKLESLGVLAGGIAHDFNNLLTTIIGNAEMLGTHLDPTDSSARSHLDKIDRTTRRLAELTRQMLAYSGRGQLRIGQLNLNEIIREMTDFLIVSTPKNVQVSFDLDPGLPSLEGDAAQIRQVILNLLTNAAEAIGEAPGGRVIVGTDALTINVDEARELYPEQELAPGQFVRLEVSDNGSGMSEETLSKIFDPFFTTKFTGRGLGLAALRGIVRGHSGGIRILSQPGEGTVFSLVFPAIGPKAASILPTVEPAASAALAINHAHVLVVDDEEGLRSLMVSALEDAGCTVYAAADGEEGVEQFQRHREDIDVVVLDLTMPRLNGDEVYRRIRSCRPNTQVIMCSGYTEKDIVRHFDSRGLAGFIEKPFKPSELIEKIGLVLASLSGKSRTDVDPSSTRATAEARATLEKAPARRHNPADPFSPT